MALVFYDTETTGKAFAFDQIVQFAGIRTDHDLNEVARFETRSRLMPHVVPSLEAIIKNRLSPTQLTDIAAPSHYAMSQEIYRTLLAWSPAMFIGFNNVGFDEHMLRHMLYKTLLPPYLTNTNKNNRTDVLKMARATTIFEPGALTIPTDAQGRYVFDLVSLARANGFYSHRPHDAVSDAEATLHLARIIMNEAPSVWSTFMRFSQKSAVIAFVNEEVIFNLTDFYSGRAYSWLVTCLGPSPSVSSDLIVFDLQVDPDDLIGLDEEDLVERLQDMPKPLKRLKANACPIIGHADEAPEIASAGYLDQDERERRVRLIRETPGFRKRLISAFETLQPTWPEPVHVEQRIYQSFTSDADHAILKTFHNAAWADRPAILAKISDTRLRALGLELIYLEAPYVLPDDIRQQHQQSHYRRVLDHDRAPGYTTLFSALSALESHLPSCDPEDLALLTEHQEFLRNLQQQMQDRAA